MHIYIIGSMCYIYHMLHTTLHRPYNTYHIPYNQAYHSCHMIYIHHTRYHKWHSTGIIHIHHTACNTETTHIIYTMHIIHIELHTAYILHVLMQDSTHIAISLTLCRSQIFLHTTHISYTHQSYTSISHVERNLEACSPISHVQMEVETYFFLRLVRPGTECGWKLAFSRSTPVGQDEHSKAKTETKWVIIIAVHGTHETCSIYCCFL